MIILKKIYDLLKNKVWPFIKKNWRYLLVIPILYAIYRWIKGRTSPIINRPPNTLEDQQELENDVHQLDQHANTEIQQIESQAVKEKNGVDHGNPTPAQVFDREIKK